MVYRAEEKVSFEILGVNALFEMAAIGIFELVSEAKVYQGDVIHGAPAKHDIVGLDIVIGSASRVDGF